MTLLMIESLSDHVLILGKDRTSANAAAAAAVHAQKAIL